MNFSAGIPLYLTKPSTAKGTAVSMHTQLTASMPITGLKRKYEIMDAATKDAAVVASSDSEQALSEVAIQCAGEKFYPFID